MKWTLSFICAICHRELETGDEFFIVNGHLLLCKDDYHDHNNQQYQGKKKWSFHVEKEYLIYILSVHLNRTAL